jgi:hypothetical protein
MHDFQKHENNTEVPPEHQWAKIYHLFVMLTANTTTRFALWNVVVRVLQMIFLNFWV